MAFKSGDGTVSLVDNTVFVTRQATTAFSDISGGYDTTTAPVSTGDRRFKASTTVAGDYFGAGVAIGSGVVAISSPYYDGSTSNSGAVDLWRLKSGEFSSTNFIAHLEVPSNVYANGQIPQINDLLGSDENSLAVGCGRVVASSRYAGSSDIGAAYIWDTNGRFISAISNPEGSNFYDFGSSVDVGCGVIVVGHLNYSGFHVFDLNGNHKGSTQRLDSELCWETRVGCGMIVAGFPSDGKIKIYDLNANLMQTLNLPSGHSGTGSSGFGNSMAIGSGRLVVGNGISPSVTQGTVHVWKVRPPGSFPATPDFELNSPSPTNGNQFGAAVSVGDGRIVVGEYGYNTSTGRAYVYDLDGNYLSTLTANNPGNGDQFGKAVAVGGGKIIVGARLEDGDTNTISQAGAAYQWDTPKQTHYMDLDKYEVFN